MGQGSSHKTGHGKGWRALARDVRGNVGLIGAVSVIPLLALIGGGLDMGRGYMARTQLQAACDAGVLAGRRAMSVSGEFGSAEKAKAARLFNFNFDGRAVDATGVTFVTEANADGQVTGTARATVPTVVMDMFGNESFAIETDCMAELQVANADIMFVLDTTGSMGGTRIAGLRDAVRDFHRTMNGAVTDDNTRIRYGFVPYSMTVNAKDLFADPDAPMQVGWFVDSAPYESREAQFNTPVHVGKTVDLGTTYETYSTMLDENDCNDFGDNRLSDTGDDEGNSKGNGKDKDKDKDKDKGKSNGNGNGDGSNPETSGSAPGKVTSTTYAFHSWAGGTNKDKWCTRSVRKTETTYTTKFAFTNWRYKQTVLDTSLFRTGAAVMVGTAIAQPPGSIVEEGEAFTYADQAGYYDMVTMATKNGSGLYNVGLTSMVWDGCLEERDTVDDGVWSPVPAGAFDLDLDLVPASTETRWRPAWRGLTYYRSHRQHVDTTQDYSNAYFACPAPMKPFTEVELSDDPQDVPGWLDTYVNGLVATGNTYHDIGMIWGGRLSSPRGPFAANVNKDGKPVSRHLIFMSDGQMEPYIWGYNAYGIEVLSNRVAPFGSDTGNLRARHIARFRAACEAVKAQGTTVWVIAFGTTLTSDMLACSSDGRAYQSNDTAALRTQFRFIASQVANLRLGA